MLQCTAASPPPAPASLPASAPHQQGFLQHLVIEHGEDGGAAAHAAGVLSPSKAVVLLVFQGQHNHAQQLPALAGQPCGAAAGGR